MDGGGEGEWASQAGTGGRGWVRAAAERSIIRAAAPTSSHPSLRVSSSHPCCLPRAPTTHSFHMVGHAFKVEAAHAAGAAGACRAGRQQAGGRAVDLAVAALARAAAAVTACTARGLKLAVTALPCTFDVAQRILMVYSFVAEAADTTSRSPAAARGASLAAALVGAGLGALGQGHCCRQPCGGGVEHTKVATEMELRRSDGAGC